MFIPKKTKYKKQQKGRCFKKITQNNLSVYKKSGTLYLKAMSAGRITSKHLLTCRQAINKIIKKHGFLRIMLLADTPISKKPTEIRMGKGKGAVNLWVCRVKPGTTMFKIKMKKKKKKKKNKGIDALQRIQNKLPIDTKIIRRLKK